MMPVTVRVEPLQKDIDLIFREDLSPAARSATLARFARQTLADAEAVNETAVGHVPPHTTTVDGRQGASEDSVRPDGTIAYEFSLLEDVFAWIGEQLVQHSPVQSGRYARSHLFFVDGVELEPTSPVPPGFTEAVFLNAVPYARKIERGESPQAPDGVYEAVAVMAQRRFGNLVKVRFAYRTPVGGSLAQGKTGDRSTRRTPAIVITPR